MELKPSTENALDKWMGTDTWYKLNDSDMNRFYDFVNQYQGDHGFMIDGPVLRKAIERKIKFEVDEDIRNMIRKYISIAQNILDFLKQTDR